MRTPPGESCESSALAPCHCSPTAACGCLEAGGYKPLPAHRMLTNAFDEYVEAGIRPREAHIACRQIGTCTRWIEASLVPGYLDDGKS